MEVKTPKPKTSGMWTALLITSIAAGVLFIYPLRVYSWISFYLGYLPDLFAYANGLRAFLEFFAVILLIFIPVAVLAAIVSTGKPGRWMQLTMIASIISAAAITLQILLAMTSISLGGYFRTGGFLTLLLLVILVVMLVLSRRIQVDASMAPVGTVPSDASVRQTDNSTISQGITAQTPALADPTVPAQKMGFLRILFSDRGRINRGQFWGYSILAAFLYAGTIGICTAIMATSGSGDSGFQMGSFAGLVIFVTSLMLIWITLALTIKRYHDLDKSAWWLLIALIPVIGSVWQFIETGFVAGTPGPNRYGPKP